MGTAVRGLLEGELKLLDYVAISGLQESRFATLTRQSLAPLVGKTPRPPANLRSLYGDPARIIRAGYFI